MGGTPRIPPARLAALGAIGTAQRYRQGTYLFREGDHSDHVIVIVHGTAKIFSTAESGYETVLAIRSAGEIIGEFAAFDRRPRSASVVALSDIDSMRVPGDGFRRYLRTDPDLALAMLGGLVDRVRESDRRRLEFGAYDVASRVRLLLLELAQRHGWPAGAAGAAGPRIEVTLSQQELAGAVGASREAVARILRSLRDQGAISTGRQRIAVLRPDLLQPAVPQQHQRRDGPRHGH